MGAKNKFYFTKKKKKKVQMKNRDIFTGIGEAECRQALSPKGMINGRVANIAKWIILDQGGQVQSAQTAMSTRRWTNWKCKYVGKGKKDVAISGQRRCNRRRHSRISTRESEYEGMYMGG